MKAISIKAHPMRPDSAKEPSPDGWGWSAFDKDTGALLMESEPEHRKRTPVEAEYAAVVALDEPGCIFHFDTDDQWSFFPERQRSGPIAVARVKYIALRVRVTREINDGINVVQQEDLYSLCRLLQRVLGEEKVFSEMASGLQRRLDSVE